MIMTESEMDEQLDIIGDFWEEQERAEDEYDARQAEIEEAYFQGAREFAEKLIDKCKENYENKDLALECKKCMIWRREEILEALSEWQEGEAE